MIKTGYGNIIILNLIFTLTQVRGIAYEKRKKREQKEQEKKRKQI